MSLPRVLGALLRVNPLLPLLLAVSVFLGRGEKAACAIIALLAHETGHLLAARLSRARLSEIEFTPFGGVMTFPELHMLSRRQGFLIAVAGPLANLLLCFLSAALHRWQALPEALARELVRADFALLLINLLPVLPLDGGRALRALLGKRSERFLTALGAGIGAGLCVCSVIFLFRGIPSLSPAFAGLYLIYAAMLERRNSSARYITALVARRQKLEKGGVLRFEWLAARADLPLFRLAGALTPGRYHVVRILHDDGLTTLAELDENALCAAILDHPSGTLGDAIR